MKSASALWLRSMFVLRLGMACALPVAALAGCGSSETGTDAPSTPHDDPDPEPDPEPEPEPDPDPEPEPDPDPEPDPEPEPDPDPDPNTVDGDGDGYAPQDGDCDDEDAAVNPGATELCSDGIDNDCDGGSDATEPDDDGDGVSMWDGDCDDDNGAIHPGAVELCSDGVDNDCDGGSDATEPDDDGDGKSVCAGDCNDADAAVHPGATELCSDGIDNDCDGGSDATEPDDDGDGFSVCTGDCNDAASAVNPGAAELCADGIDNDCDGTMDADEPDGDGDGFKLCGGDCNDADGAVHPGAPELCSDGIDNDCDGAMDAEEPDADGDGVTVCGGDCNDAVKTVHPGATEVCENSVDDDCNGVVDTDCPECDLAALHPSSEGCEFFAYDANNDPPEGYDAKQYALVATNAGAKSANLKVQTRGSEGWTDVWTGTMTPGATETVNLADRHINYSGILPSGAYRVVSDQPISVRQFQPLAPNSFTSDASLLLPVVSYDTEYVVAGWGEPSYGNGQIAIIAAEDGTQVRLTGSTAVQAGGSVPAIAAGVPTDLPVLKAGDFIQLEMPANTPAGTRIVSNKPVAVFSANWCANIPTQVCCCDHIEEQLFGVSRFGYEYVAARMPVRNLNGSTPEQTYWQIVAHEPNTQVSFTASAGVTGLPTSPQTLAAGGVLTFGVSGTTAAPGDFIVRSDRPIMLMSFMTSSANTNAPSASAGDPAMLLMPATSQLLKRYLLSNPTVWPQARAIVYRPIGSTVTLDGVEVASAKFTSIGPAEQATWEVARLDVGTGTHVLEGTEPFGAAAVGVATYDSYAYPAGMKLAPRAP
jgi:hypothetical protein